MKYTDIQIYKTEFDDNYLLLYDNRTLLVGFIVKEILEFLQSGIYSVEEISEKIYYKHRLTIEKESINLTIEKLDSFLSKKNKESFTRIFKIFNPSKMNFGSLNFLFSTKIFYSLLLITLFLNLFFSVFLNNKFLNTKESVIWFVCLLLILFLHEIGHSISAKKFGIKCNEIGFGTYLIFPVFYVNLGESWKLERSKRIIINLSGIYFQLIIGTGLIILNYFVENKIIIHLFFSNLMIILINLNPFIKFDGYWILSDVIDVKNLSKKSNGIIKNFLIFNMDFVKNKFWIYIYSILKLFFLAFIFLYVLTIIYKIVSKIFANIPLSAYDYLLVIILLTIIFKKYKK